MNFRTFTIVAAVTAGAFTATQVNAELLTYFNFNNSTAGSGGGPGTFDSTGTVEIYDASTGRINIGSGGVSAATSYVDLSNLTGSMGGSSGNNNWGTFGGTNDNALFGDTSGGALAVIGSGNNGHYVDFGISMAGYQDPIISFSTRGTGTGFDSGVWSWSTDGSAFTTLTGVNTATRSTSFGSRTVDFSSFDGLDNAGITIFRYTLSGASGTGGNNRIDNVQINATAVPEPAAFSLVGLGGLSLLARRRRHHA